MSSRWPLWIGSKDPGYSTMVMPDPPVRAAGSWRSDGDHRSPVAPSPSPPPSRRERRSGRSDSHTARSARAPSSRSFQRVEGVGRVEQRQVAQLARAAAGAVADAPRPGPGEAASPSRLLAQRGERVRGRVDEGADGARPGTAPRCRARPSRRTGRAPWPPSTTPRLPSALNIASRTRSDVGRVAVPAGATSRRPPALRRRRAPAATYRRRPWRSPDRC